MYTYRSINIEKNILHAGIYLFYTHRLEVGIICM